MKSLIATSLIVIAASLGVTASAYAQTSAAAASAPAPTKKSIRIANRQLSRNVRKALTKDSKIDVSHITVIAKNGAISLEGSVPEDGQIALATQIATGVNGVSAVANHLSIATSGH